LFTDVKVKSSPKKSPQKEFRCHLCILLPRFYFLFNKYFGEISFDDEESIEAVLANKLVNKTIVLEYRHEIVAMILKYLYTDDASIFLMSKGFELDLIDALFDLGFNKEAKNLLKRVNKKPPSKTHNFPEYSMGEQLGAAVTSEKRRIFNKKGILKKIEKDIQKQNEELKSKGKFTLTKKAIEIYTDEKYEIYSKSAQDRIKLEHIMRTLSDIAIGSKDEKKFLYCHKAILISRSTYFNILLAGFFSDVGNFTSLEISYDALETVIIFIYTNKCIIGSSAIEVLTTANQLNLHVLKKRATDFIGKNIDETNCVDLFRLANMCESEKLKTLCKNFFLTDEFKKSVEPDVCLISYDGKRFKDYQCILASHSNYFMEKFFYEDDQKELPIDFNIDLNYKACSAFVLGYTGKISLHSYPPEVLVDLLVFADTHGFDLLGKKCRNVIPSHSSRFEMLCCLVNSENKDHYLVYDTCNDIFNRYRRYLEESHIKNVLNHFSFNSVLQHVGVGKMCSVFNEFLKEKIGKVPDFE
jgi:hypothetical protein